MTLPDRETAWAMEYPLFTGGPCIRCGCRARMTGNSCCAKCSGGLDTMMGRWMRIKAMNQFLGRARP